MAVSLPSVLLLLCSFAEWQQLRQVTVVAQLTSSLQRYINRIPPTCLYIFRLFRLFRLFRISRRRLPFILNEMAPPAFSYFFFFVLFYNSIRLALSVEPIAGPLFSSSCPEIALKLHLNSKLKIIKSKWARL